MLIEVIWKVLEKNEFGLLISKQLKIKNMYNCVTTSMKIEDGVIEDFSIITRLQKELSLSPYLFTLILDVLTIYQTYSRSSVTNACFFTINIVLVEELRKEISGKFRIVEALKIDDFHISRSKI